MLELNTQLEAFILSNYLSDYPENCNFNEVLTLLEDDSDDITVWEPFEYWDKEVLADHINDMCIELLLTVKPYIKKD
jgi:hypothetical protein